MLAVLVLVLTAVSCTAIPREDMLEFGAVQTGGPGGGWNMLNQPVHFFGRSVGLSQVSPFQMADISCLWTSVSEAAECPRLSI